MTKKKAVKEDIASTLFPSGKIAYKHDKRTLRFRDIINEHDKDKIIPESFDWATRIKPSHNWGDYGNLKLNNCTFVTAAYLIMIWKSYKAPQIYRPGVYTIIDDYCELLKDAKPEDKSLKSVLEAGGEPLEAMKVLKYWRKNGIDGHKIIAFAKLSYNASKKQRIAELKRAVYLYGGCFIGVNIPRSVEKQWQQSKKWDIIRGVPGGDARRRLWFSHAMLVTGYTEKDIRVVTFGKEEILTWEFYLKYVDEAYALFDERFLRARKTPSKMKVQELKTAVTTIKKESSPAKKETGK